MYDWFLGDNDQNKKSEQHKMLWNSNNIEGSRKRSWHVLSRESFIKKDDSHSNTLSNKLNVY